MMETNQTEFIAAQVYKVVFDERDGRCIHQEIAADIFGINIDDFALLFLSDIQENLQLSPRSIIKVYDAFFALMLTDFHFEQHMEEDTGAYYVTAE